MKLIKGQYVSAKGCTVVIERHDNMIEPMVSVTVNMGVTVRVPCKLYLAGTFDQRYPLLRPVIQRIWGLEPKTLPETTEMVLFTEILQRYCL